MRFLLVLLAMATAVPALAADSTFTADQRREIVQILRDALKTDPTILRDAVVSLQAADQASEAAELKTKLAQKRQALLADPADYVAGNPAGDVTMVEFYDPRCPYCRRMVPTLAGMLKKDPGLRLVYKDIPVLGPPSVLESRAILAAQRQGAYGRMQEALMANPAQPSDSMIAETARGLGLDPVKLATDMQSRAVSEKIAANMALARTLKLEGTPVFIVGDTLIPGAVDQPSLEAAIADARQAPVR
jgi:protein-disulfide isomerase